jgi:hypothetical protein
MNEITDIQKQLFAIPGVGSQAEKRTLLFLRFSAVALTAQGMKMAHIRLEDIVSKLK